MTEMSFDISCSESQIEHLLVEWSQYNESLEYGVSDEESSIDDESPLNDRKYQLEFVRSLFTDDEIKEKFPHLLAPEANGAQHEDMLNRTVVDIETRLSPYVIHSSNGTKTYFRDLEAFLESEVISIKNAKPSTNNSPKSAKSRAATYTSTPLPLLIEDVLQVDLSGSFNDARSIFGREFRTVMIHGISKPTSGGSKNEKRRKYYTVDDGTGSIRVQFDHGTYRKDLLRRVEILRGDYFIAKREGVVCADRQLLQPQSEKCKQILRDVETLLKCIDRNNRMVDNSFTAGAKMFVVGMPFWSESFKEVQLIAYHIHEDGGPNRDMEINFKRHLFRLYETRYLKFSRDGKPIR